MLSKIANRYWYSTSPHLLTYCLLPFSFMFGVLSNIRRIFYKVGLLKTRYFPVPVIVVGNITVGGTGKTPFVIWLAHFLKQQGYQPAIVSRGYCSQSRLSAYWVSEKDQAKIVGDEAILLYRQAQCPVVVGKDRIKSIETILQRSTCNIIICDDGLQHYRLGRSLEIAMQDAKRGVGNGYLLPAGPLREKPQRLQTVNFVIKTEGHKDDIFSMQFIAKEAEQLSTNKKMPLNDFLKKHPQIHAVAGIGHPERFFSMLHHHGFNVSPHAFPDHHAYVKQAFTFADTKPILMTEKDGVKCAAFADERFWVLPIQAKLNQAFEVLLLQQLQSNGVSLC